MAMSCKDGKGGILDNGKYVRYTPEQVEALERLYHECPKPSSIRRQQLIRECPILSNIEPKQIKVWFQNRRYKINKPLSLLPLQLHTFHVMIFGYGVRVRPRARFHSSCIVLQMQRETEERSFASSRRESQTISDEQAPHGRK